MSELIVPIVKLDEIRKHPNADQLEIAIVGGWQVVVKKDQFKLNDTGIFFPPDSVLEQKLSDQLGVTNYLSSKGRVKAIRLRGEPSHGFLAHIKDFGESIKVFKVGDNVAEFLGVKKYEEAVPVQKLIQNRDRVLPEIPEFPKYTDIENFRNFPDVFKDDDFVVITEKVHGCLHKDTLITLANGEKVPISQIKRGYSILSFDEKTKTFIPSKVKHVIKRDNTKKIKWMELDIDGNIICCTVNHKFLTSNRGWIEAQNLTETDDIISNIDF